MERLKILFLCTGNACRSQMAEGWAKALRSDQLEAYSAGIEPHGVNPLAAKVMAEAGVDISSQYSKTLDDLPGVEYDWVITLCGHAQDNCPFFPGSVKRLHAGFDDPPKLAEDATTEEEALPHYRKVRDAIRTFVVGLPDTLKQS